MITTRIIIMIMGRRRLQRVNATTNTQHADKCFSEVSAENLQDALVVVGDGKWAQGLGVEKVIPAGQLGDS